MKQNEPTYLKRKIKEGELFIEGGPITQITRRVIIMIRYVVFKLFFYKIFL